MAAAAALVFFVGVIGAFAVDDTPEPSSEVGAGKGDGGSDGGGDGDGGGDAGSDGESGNVTVPGDAVATTAPPTTAKGATQTTAKAGSSSGGGPAPGASADPASMPAVKMPQPGVYRYKSKTTSDGTTEEKDVEAKLEAAGSQGGVTRFRLTQESAQGRQTHTLAWAADAVRLERTEIQSPMGGTFDCDWNPDSTELMFPLKTGVTWKVDSSCTVTFNGQSVTLRRTGDYKVTGAVTTTVGGASVKAWVIEGSGSIAFGPQGSSFTSVSRFAPEPGLRIYERIETSDGDAEERTLTNLKPA